MGPAQGHTGQSSGTAQKGALHSGHRHDCSAAGRQQVRRDWRTPPPSLVPLVPLPRAGRLDLGLAPLCDPSKNYGRIAFLRGESAQAWGSIGLCAAQVSCARGQVFEAARVQHGGCPATHHAAGAAGDAGDAGDAGQITVGLSERPAQSPTQIGATRRLTQPAITSSCADRPGLTADAQRPERPTRSLLDCSTA